MVVLVRDVAVPGRVVDARQRDDALYLDSLQRGGEGAQHLACWTDTGFDDTVARLLSVGYVEGHSGRMGTRGRFAYFVHPDLPGGMFEVSEMAVGKGEYFRGIRHAAEAWHGSDPIRRVFDGEEAVRGYFDSSRTPFPDLANEVIAIAADQDTVLVEFWLSGTHLGPLPANGQVFEATGRRFRIRMAASFEFAPGSDKIICERPYSAPDAKLRALGLV